MVIAYATLDLRELKHKMDYPVNEFQDLGPKKRAATVNPRAIAFG
jgi:hypothetical protein